MMKTRVIKTGQENDAALARIEELMELEPSSEVVDELELLSTLVELYEEIAYPSPCLNPIDAIRFRMEQQNLKQKDLVPYIGSKSKVSEVLSGKRALSLSMIRKLHEGLGIALEVLVPPVPPSDGAATELEQVAEEHTPYRINERIE